MPTLSAGDLVLLRTHPHSFKEYLAILQPGTILACQLNGAPSGDPVTSITYDNVTEGAFGNVMAGMTLWIGSAAGGRDKGTCRVRSATADTLYIAEDSAIDWVDDDYLTVVENYELWVKYPRIVVNGSLVFYKDWDVAYTDQHEDWAPVAIMGPPDCQFIDSGVATCEFVGEHSYPVAPGATISTYAWAFPSGTPATASTAGTDAAPHEVTWDTAGIYWVTLTVTDDNGKAHIGRRPVFIFDRTGANVPYTRFKMSSRQSDLNQHGHTVTFEIHGDADQAEFPDGALVIYFTEDWYGSTKQSIGGNYTGRAHIKFVGYIQKESTTKNPETSVVTFDAATINALMDSREGFSCWIKNKGSVSNWTEATNLTADRAALSLCRYHSSLLDINDVVISGDTEYIKSQEFAAKTSLLQQLQTLYNDLFGHVACDKQGRLYCEIDPQMLAVADRSSIPIICDLGHGDWRDRLDLPRPQEAKTSFINLAGVHYAGYPYAVEPILSKAPGDAPAYVGKTIEISGLILGGQADGNEKAGLALARENNQFPDITLPMPGLWDVFDIVPQEYVRLSLAAGDTKRGIVWTNQKLIPRRVELAIEETKAGRVPKVTIHVEKDSFGPAGVDGDYPDEVPEPSIPLIPYPPSPPLPPGGTPGDGHLYYFVCATTGQVFRSRNARAPTPGDVVYEPLGVVDAGGLLYITLDSWYPKTAAVVCGPNGAWKTTNLDATIPTWTQVYANPSGRITMVGSSICQLDLWMMVRQYPAGLDDAIRCITSIDGCATWPTSATIVTDANAAGPNAKLEMSSHNAQVAWITWLWGNGTPYMSKTIDQGVSFSKAGLGTTAWKWPANPHHRYHENPTDLIANWAGGYVTRYCTSELAACTNGVITQYAEWQGTYTWGTDRYWILANNHLFVSDDGIIWTDQGAIGATHRHCSGWPYLGEWFYATQDGVVAPLRISDDRGVTWQEQTGNWATLGCSGNIACGVAVWIE